MGSLRRVCCLLALVISIAPATLSGQCGVERWSVKTGTDPDAGKVNLGSSSSTTIAHLRSFAAPNPIPSNRRVAPAETTQWVINATLTKYKVESDSDYHLVVVDGSGRTMIVEIPSPTCVGSGSPFFSGIQNARSEFNARFTATTSFKTTSTPVQIRGIGMFDFLHGQTGVAPSGIELHPVMNIVFNPGAAVPLNGAAPSPAPDIAFDDDGGQVQIIPVKGASQRDKQYHGGRVMSSVQQVSVFLGSGWSDTQIRARESVLSDLAPSEANDQQMREHGIATMRPLPLQEDFSDLRNVSVNDLVIQGKLAELLQTKAIPAPSPATVYVVFLGPEINSTLGGLKAGIGYAAYHNFVNLEAGEIRYVVVPYHEDSALHSAAAAHAFAEVALNPNGTGWF